MIKAVTLIKRREGMDVEAFQAHWRNRHPDIVCRLPGIARYHQSHVRLGGYAKGEPVFDGVAEVWFENVDAMRALPGTAVHDALIADEERFIDRSRMMLLLTEDQPIKDGVLGPGAVKSFELVRMKQDMRLDEFQAYWRDVHGPLGSRLPGMRRYVQSHVRKGAYREGRRPGYDGLAITWFDSVDAMRAAARTPEYAALRNDERNFLEIGTSPILITTEHVIVE